MMPGHAGDGAGMKKDGAALKKVGVLDREGGRALAAFLA